jgi:3D (Asp-Asp-Asp) domain-containing protein
MMWRRAGHSSACPSTLSARARRRQRGAGGPLAACLLAAAGLVALSGCAGLGRGPAAQERSLVVTATAYVAHGSAGRVPVGAWGDPLPQGTRAVAVSQDLHAHGLVRGTRVRVEGMPGEWQVLDRMPKRWQRRIDLYMGRDRAAALAWGRRQVRIFFRPPQQELASSLALP